jgi:ribosomal-protein-alanine N-acetyltransferase
MRRRHLRSVMRIEAQVYPRPWSLPLFMSELNLRSSRIYYVARVNGLVVGYCGLMLVEGDGHITNIAVDPAWHRHQIGTRLLLNAARQAAARDATRLTLEVRMSNRAAQDLYRKFGFEAAGVRKNYYAESREDALIMWAYGLDTDAYAQRVAGIEASLRGSTLVEDGEPGR